MQDILSYKSQHVGPPVIPEDEFQCFEVASMPSNSGVVAERDNLVVKVGGWRDVDATLVVEQSIAFRPLSRSY